MYRSREGFSFFLANSHNRSAMLGKICAKLSATCSSDGPLQLSHNNLSRLEINGRTCDILTWKAFRLATHTLLAVLVTAFLLALSPTAVGAGQPMFGRLFPNLPPYDGPSDDALTALTCGQTALSTLCTLQTPVPSPAGPLMGPLFDQNVTAPTSNNDDNPDNV